MTIVEDRTIPFAVPPVRDVPKSLIGTIDDGYDHDGQPPNGHPAMSVLHVINGEHFSGAERVQQILGKRLTEYGVAADFACLKPGKFQELCDLSPESVFSIPMKSRWDISAVKRLAEIVRSGNYNLLHAHTPRSAFVTGLVSRRCQVPWVYHLHSPAGRDSTRTWINRINHYVERWSLRTCSRIYTVSESLRNDLLRQGWHESKVTTIANGVAKQIPIDSRSRLSSNHWRLGMIALFRPRKGLETLLEAVAKLSKSTSTFQLDLIGSFETSEYELAMRAMVDRYGLQSKVHFVGFTKDVTAAIKNLDAMILPSHFGEGMPMVVLESLACGVPVIATRVEGTPEVLRDSIEGYLAEPRNALSLMHAIEQLLECRETWSLMSDKAVERHRSKYSDVHMAGCLAREYRRLVTV